MKDEDFLSGLQGSEWGSEELASSAEHFVRLKKQTGLAEHQQEQEFAKEAKVFGESQSMDLYDRSKTAAILGEQVPHPSYTESLPLPERVGEHLKYVDKKSKERATPYHKAMGGYGAAGALTGTGIAALGSKKHGKGALIGGTLGAALGALVAKGDRKEISKAKFLAEAGKKSGKSKKASVTEALKNAVKKNPMLFGLAAGGALVGGGVTYLRTRPTKPDGKSHDERDSEDLVKYFAGPEDGLMRKLRGRTAEAAHGYAKALREHPGKASLLGTVGGAATGIQVARLLGAGGK